MLPSRRFILKEKGNILCLLNLSFWKNIPKDTGNRKYKMLLLLILLHIIFSFISFSKWNRIPPNNGWWKIFSFMSLSGCLGLVVRHKTPWKRMKKKFPPTSVSRWRNRLEGYFMSCNSGFCFTYKKIESCSSMSYKLLDFSFFNNDSSWIND